MTFYKGIHLSLFLILSKPTYFIMSTLAYEGELSGIPHLMNDFKWFF